MRYNMIVVGRLSEDSLLSKSRLLAAPLDALRTAFVAKEEIRSDTQYALAIPNPLNSKHSVVILNVMPDMWRSSEFNPPLKGFYDYALWDRNGHLLDSGFFSDMQLDRLQKTR
jgi:hypothetical protein